MFLLTIFESLLHLLGSISSTSVSSLTIAFTKSPTQAWRYAEHSLPVDGEDGDHHIEPSNRTHDEGARLVVVVEALDTTQRRLYVRE